VKQERFTLPENLSSPPDLSGVRVTRSLVLYVCLVDRCLSFLTLFFLPIVLYEEVCVTNDHGYVPFGVSTSRSFPHSCLITGFVTRLTQWVPLVEQELRTLPEHPRLLWGRGHLWHRLPRSWLITWCVTKLTHRVSLVKQERFTLPENLSSYWVFCSSQLQMSQNVYHPPHKEEFENTKGVFKIRISKKNIQHNDPVIRHEWGKDREVLTPNGTYPWSFVTQTSSFMTYHLVCY
jgi:hypothetical protein